MRLFSPQVFFNTHFLILKPMMPVNYGGIAAVIGHEMTHGFDDEGRKYAADGNLKDWWTKDDAASFDKRANQVVTQYNGFTVLDTLHVNGKLTLGEKSGRLRRIDHRLRSVYQNATIQRRKKD